MSWAGLVGRALGSWPLTLRLALLLAIVLVCAAAIVVVRF